MKPADASVLLNDIGADRSSALRLSVVTGWAMPSTPRRRTEALLTRPANDLPASWAPALPVSGTSLLPSPGAAARAGFIPVLLRGRGSHHIAVHSGGSGPAFKTCLPQSRAGASVSSHTRRGLTSGCSGLAALAAEP